MKNIQVFVGDGNSAEINGILVSIRYKDAVLFVQHKEDGFPEVLENHFPLHQVKMVRIWEEPDEAA